MSQSVVSGTGSDPLLAELIEEITDKLQRGEAVDLEAHIQQHPERAEELRKLMPALHMLAVAGSAAGSDDEPETSGQEENPLSGVLGDFRIIREIGRGGMGVVYEAEQISLRRRVALKVLPFAAMMDPRQLQRFRNEAQAEACLNHNHIVPVYFVGCERGVHFYAMQLIEGQTLAGVIADLRLQIADLSKTPSLARRVGLSTPTRSASEGQQPTPSADAVATVSPSAAEQICNLKSAICNPTKVTLSTQTPRERAAYYRQVAQVGCASGGGFGLCTPDGRGTSRRQAGQPDGGWTRRGLDHGLRPGAGPARRRQPHIDRGLDRYAPLHESGAGSRQTRAD